MSEVMMRIGSMKPPCVLALIALSVLFIGGPTRGADVPYLSGRVVDNAEILKPQTRGAVTEKLKAHEQKTSNQIAVLTVPTIGDESIEEYAVKVFETGKLGRKGKDNGDRLVV